MEKIEIYNKNGELLGSTKEFTYSSEFMGESKIVASLYSPDKIDFSVGSYCSYSGSTFTIFRNRPVATKIARSGENIGNALKYTITLISEVGIFDNIIFQDFVTTDDTEHYHTGNSDVNFFGNAIQLADRIKSNLDRFIGAEGWSISFSSSIFTLQEKQVSVNGIKLSEALNLFNNIFELPYFIYGKNIIIGGSGNLISENPFKYGKGNGIYELNRTFENGIDVTTRLKVYGSEKNIPSDYLRSVDGRGRYYTRLMLPNFSITKRDYVDSEQSVIDEYGIIENEKTFEDIFPTIEGVDIGNGRIDEFQSTSSVILDQLNFDLKVLDFGFDINDLLIPGQSAKVSIKSLNADGTPCQLAGYEFTVFSYVPSQGTGGGTLTLIRQNESGANLPDEYLKINKGDRFVLLDIEMPDSLIKEAEKRLEIAGQEYLTSDGSIDLSYLVKVDEKFIHENNLTGSIDSGDRVIIEDDDLGVANEFTVQSISIRHGSKLLPTYDIKFANIKASTLRSEFRKSQYNQSSYNYVNSSTVSNTVNNTTTITGGDLEWQILD